MQGLEEHWGLPAQGKASAMLVRAPGKLGSSAPNVLRLQAQRRLQSRCQLPVRACGRAALAGSGSGGAAIGSTRTCGARGAGRCCSCGCGSGCAHGSRFVERCSGCGVWRCAGCCGCCSLQQRQLLQLFRGRRPEEPIQTRQPGEWSLSLGSWLRQGTAARRGIVRVGREQAWASALKEEGYWCCCSIACSQGCVVVAGSQAEKWGEAEPRRGRGSAARCKFTRSRGHGPHVRKPLELASWQRGGRS